jgi:hypothetical protein
MQIIHLTVYCFLTISTHQDLGAKFKTESLSHLNFDRKHIGLGNLDTFLSERRIELMTL